MSFVPVFVSPIEFRRLKINETNSVKLVTIINQSLKLWIKYSSFHDLLQFFYPEHLSSVLDV